MSELSWKCNLCKASFFKEQLLVMHRGFFHKEQDRPVAVQQPPKQYVSAADMPGKVLEKMSAVMTPTRQSDDSDDSESDRIRLEKKFNHLKVVKRVHKVSELPEGVTMLNPSEFREVKIETNDSENEEPFEDDTEREHEPTGHVMTQEMWETLQQQDELCYLVVKEDGIYVSNEPPVEDGDYNPEEMLADESGEYTVENMEETTYEDGTVTKTVTYYEHDEDGDSDTAICYRPEQVTTVAYKPTRVMAKPVPGDMELRKLKAMKSQGLHVKRLGVLEFKCKRCELVFPTRHERRLHLETHAKDLRHFCNVCGRGFRKTHSLKLHLNVHTEGSHHQCPYCHRFYRAHRYLKEHIKLHMPEEYKYQCEICSKKFAHRVSWRYHMRSHTNDTPFVCSLCGKAYRQRVSLEAHMNLHEGARPHECAECGKGFRTATTLRDHRRLHTNERPFICRHPGCDKKYILKNQLKNHMLKHTGVRNFACTVGHCDKRFFFRSHLVRHLTRTHKLRCVTPPPDDESAGATQAQPPAGRYALKQEIDTDTE